MEPNDISGLMELLGLLEVEAEPTEPSAAWTKEDLDLVMATYIDSSEFQELVSEAKSGALKADEARRRLRVIMGSSDLVS